MSPEQRLLALERGENNQFVARMRSGYVVMANSQFLPGYCILLASPIVPKLNDMTAEARAIFLEDMATLGDAIIAVTGAIRANYGIYGNVDPFVHAHVWPRFAEEADELRYLAPMQFPAELRGASDNLFSSDRHGSLQTALQLKLAELEAAR